MPCLAPTGGGTEASVIDGTFTQLAKKRGILMNNKSASAIASAFWGVLLLGGTMAAQAAEVSGNVTYTTDYRFRGISQGDRSQAIQGGFDIAADNGLYAGTWASNVTFSGAAIEVDYYAGYATELNDNTAIDVGVLWYNYPEDDSDPDLDYWEVYGSVGFYGATVGVNYSPDYFAETDSFVYVYGDYSYPLVENLSLDLHVGWNVFKDDESFAAFIGPDVGEDPGDDYIDYSIGLSTSAVGLDFALNYIGTDLDDEECFAGTKLCEGSIVASVSKSL
jgi:uncharacterized protein (TIGR02001 family)